MGDGVMDSGLEDRRGRNGGWQMSGAQGAVGGRYRYRYRYGRCRGTIFNERRPARHGQWRTPWIVSPEARWPTRVFGKSFRGDGGVKPPRECVLSRLFFTRRRCHVSSVAVRRQRQSAAVAGREGRAWRRWVGGGIAAPLRTLDAIAGLPASAHLGSGRARWQGWRRRWLCGRMCLLPRVITGSLTVEGRSVTPFRFASERRDDERPHLRALPPP